MLLVTETNSKKLTQLHQNYLNKANGVNDFFSSEQIKNYTSFRETLFLMWREWEVMPLQRARSADTLASDRMRDPSVVLVPMLVKTRVPLTR